MGKKLEQSKAKHERLQKELDDRIARAMGHVAQANGQPMNDKVGGVAFFRQIEKNEQAVFAKMDELKAHEETLERVAKRELKPTTPDEVIAQAEEHIKVLEEELADETSPYSKRSIKNKIKRQQENIDVYTQMKQRSEEREKLITPKAQKLIDDGILKKYYKKPIYWFVKDLKKIAFVLDENGNWIESSTYKAYSESDKKRVAELLARQ